MTSVKPKHSLNEIRALVDEYLAGSEASIWFSAPSRSIRYVAKVFSCSLVEAEDYICEGLKMIKETDFVRQVVVFGVVRDEYGLANFESHNWYIKFSISEEDGEHFIDDLSFHPIERELKLANGRILNVTYSP